MVIEVFIWNPYKDHPMETMRASTALDLLGNDVWKKIPKIFSRMVVLHGDELPW